MAALAEHFIRNLIGAIADGSVAPVGWIIGILQAAQLTVLGWWLFLIGWWRDRWEQRRRTLLPAVLVVGLAAPWHVALLHWIVWGVGVDHLDDQVVGLVPYWWQPFTLVAFSALALSSGGYGRAAVGLRIVGGIGIGTLWLMVAVSAVGALRDGMVTAAGLPLGLIAVGQSGVLSVWLAVLWRSARING